MLISLLLVSGFVGLLLRETRSLGRERRVLLTILATAFVVRIGVSLFVRDLPLFSSGTASDARGYEAEGAAIARYWMYHGVSFVTAREWPELNETVLPANVFALSAYLAGSAAHITDVIIVDVAICYAALIYYKTTVIVGGPGRMGLAATALFLFLPSCLMYTSDAYKESFVILFVVGALYCSLNFLTRVRWYHVLGAVLCLAGLWLTRFYLTYIVMMPVTLSLVAGRLRSVQRIALVAAGILAVVAVVAAYTKLPERLSAGVSETLERGTAKDVIAGNAQGGSGVVIDEGGAASFPIKLLYTLFAPFPWQSGSIGFHLAKLEVLLWYYLVYRAVGGARAIWRRNRMALLVLLAFVVPTTIAYAMAFSNVGLTVRERMGVVMVTAIIAAARPVVARVAVTRRTPRGVGTAARWRRGSSAR